MHDPAEILRLEEAVWQAVIDKRGDSLAEKFADDYLEITVEGSRHLKGEVVETSPVVDEIENYRITDSRVIALGENAAALSYQLHLEGRLRGEPIEPQDRWVTSIWRKDDAGAWKCVLFQQTGRQA